jgi:pimeloyl-ACP methyl ester carboxylesterase
MRLTSTPLIAVLLVASVAAGGCRSRLKPVRYRLPQLGATPITSKAVVDARKSFGDVFCGVLSHTADSSSSSGWGTCERYLHLDGTASPATIDPKEKFLAGYRVLLVGGIFARCLDVEAFQDAKDHLRSEHEAVVDHLPVLGNASSAKNAELIRDHIAADTTNAPYIVVGHSKGGVDLMEALVRYPPLRSRIKALLTVASPVAGSRLVDGVPTLLTRLSERFPRIRSCELGDGLGYQSLERPTRQAFFRDHLAEVNALRSYSISAVASRADTSRALHGLWDYHAPFSIDQDTHVIADDAVVPGATFLAQANGDHWAVASPMELSKNDWLRRRSDRNHYPRPALIEAALRFIVQDLKANP